MMRKRSLACLVAVLLSAVCYVPALAGAGDEDTDNRLVEAKVVEVNDKHISVIARTGVEHVIATDKADTHVTLKGKRIAFKDLRVGDVVTVELDALKQVKFARHIVIAEQAESTLASAKD